MRPAPSEGHAPGGWATCDRVTEVAEAPKAMLQMSPLPSREIYKWAAANRIGRTLLYEAETSANVRILRDGKKQRRDAQPVPVALGDRACTRIQL